MADLAHVAPEGAFDCLFQSGQPIVKLGEFTNVIQLLDTGKMTTKS